MSTIGSPTGPGSVSAGSIAQPTLTIVQAIAIDVRIGKTITAIFGDFGVPIFCGACPVMAHRRD
ncbi:MAG: hypothetical protein QM770_20860 [Tepidisphaeraceae bacterium]